MDLWVLVVLFFIFAPLIERVLKGGQQQRRPPPRQGPRQRPLPRIPSEDQQARTQSGPTAEVESGERSAAEMLPEDFWRILTGEAPRTGGPVAAPPKPAEPRERFEVKPLPPPPPPIEKRRERVVRPSRESGPDEEAIAAARIRKRRAEVARQRAPRAAASLETPIQAEPVRHQKFHDRLDHLAPPAKIRRKAAPALAKALRGRNAMRQAVLLHEVLGKPKGLD